MAAIAIGAGVSIIGGAIASHQAGQAAKGARNDARRSKAELDAIKASRQSITNPYAPTKDISGLAKDLSGMINNPYANLGVATQAAEMQFEQTDMALANTLDTLRATGASAGGATALAQAALQSKKGIAASIEQQEVANEKLRAQGEADRNQLKMAEQQRLQTLQISEAQRVQAAEAAGKQFMFAAQEDRTNADLGREAGMLTQAMQNQASANAAQATAIGGAVQGVSSAFGNLGKTGGKAGDTKDSDRRLKNNINLIGKSPSGLNIYSFEYKDKKFGDGVFNGVMSDEIPLEAVIKGSDGYDRVNYSLIDVEFKKL